MGCFVLVCSFLWFGCMCAMEQQKKLSEQQSYVHFDDDYLSHKKLVQRYGVRGADYVQQNMTDPSTLHVPNNINIIDRSVPTEVKTQLKNMIGYDAVHQLHVSSYTPCQGPEIFAHDTVLALHKDFALRKTLPNTLWCNDFATNENIRWHGPEKGKGVTCAALDDHSVALGQNEWFLVYNGCSWFHAPLGFHREEVNGLIFAGDYLVTSSYNTIMVRQRAGQCLLASIRVDAGDVKVLTAHKTRVIYQHGMTVKLWNMYGEHQSEVIPTYSLPCSAYFDDEKLLVGMWDGTIGWYAPQMNYKLMGVLHGAHDANVTAVTEHNGVITSGSMGKLVRWLPGFDLQKECQNMSVTELALVSTLLHSAKKEEQS